MRDHPSRDCQAWKDEGLILSTTSNEAAKMYDACLTQFIGWYDDPEVGGIVNSMTLMNQADPEFVLGLAINFGLKIVGTLESISTSPELKKEFETLRNMAEKNKSTLTTREYKHSQGVLQWAEGNTTAASKIWEDILLDHPTDLQALKMANITYFYQGRSQQLRDSTARVLPVWESKRPPMKSFLYGMYGFGLLETNEFEKAELYARKALTENPNDGWSTHSLAHVFESEGRTSEGLRFLDSTVQNWEQSNHLACHNYWHMALFHLENEDYACALQVLETQIFPRASKSKSMLDIADCSSILFRLDMLSPSSLNSKETPHWSEVHDMCKGYSKHRISLFNDAHFMMAYTGAGESGRRCALELVEDLPVRKGDLASLPGIGEALLRSIFDFRRERFDKVVEALMPIRYSWTGVGGSTAQQDVFNLLLIVAALKSSKRKDNLLARGLVNERLAFKPDTALSHRFHILAQNYS